MSNRTINLDDHLHRYLLSVSLREPDVLRRLREETARMPEHNLQIAPEQGQFMAMLVQLSGARRALEIGTFTGYSSLVMALAMPNGGRIVCCDTNEQYTDVARRYWEEAGVAAKIDLRIAPALETLDKLIDDPDERQFDFAFIDADKANNDNYYERCLKLVKPGGLISFDNALWDGKVADQSERDEDTVALRALNRKLHTDDRIDLSLVPIGDGLTLCRKR
ncbi:MAG TPA: class I SAM-dependent methyltransferase [Woeseiaceae bacterium]|nr:class I SAM-dependent methyltransferase [Woeseiaceae bacterium]